MRFVQLLAAVSGLACMVVSLKAQSIKVEVRDDGQPVAVVVQGQSITDPTFNAGVPIEFTLASFTGVLTVRVFDTTLVNNLPDEEIGPVTIQGGPSSLGTSRMDFMVSGDSIFPENPGEIIEQRGGASFGSGTTPALTITNEALRRRTRVAIAVLNNIRGDITAGQIFRIQNGIVSNDTALFSGEVSANITAVTKDQDWRAQPNDPPLVFKSIEEINTIGLLSGTIVASDPIGYEPGNPTTYSNIGRVIVRGTTCTFPTYGDSFPDRR